MVVCGCDECAGKKHPVSGCRLIVFDLSTPKQNYKTNQANNSGDRPRRCSSRQKHCLSTTPFVSGLWRFFRIACSRLAHTFVWKIIAGAVRKADDGENRAHEAYLGNANQLIWRVVGRFFALLLSTRNDERPPLTQYDSSDNIPRHVLLYMDCIVHKVWFHGRDASNIQTPFPI